MKSYSQFIRSLLIEAIHRELQEILDSPESDISSTKKYTRITKKIRELSNRGEDIGLENSRSKKGSSRAVFFPKDGRKIILEGHETEVPTAVKIAFPGQWDGRQYRNHGDQLLGEMQNGAENNWYKQKEHAVIYEEDGKYYRNPEGVLPPVFRGHNEDHWLEMAKCRDLRDGEFSELTKNADFPNGLKFEQFRNALMWIHHDHGAIKNTYPKPDAKLMNHPLVANNETFIKDTGFHPGDVVHDNLGVFEDPVTGARSIVHRDYGFSNEVQREYAERRGKYYDKINAKFK